MRSPKLFFRLILAILCTLAWHGHSTAQDQNFASVDLFYVGGELVGNEYRNQALVHAITPADVTGKPVIFYPGLGLGSYIWLATPDGREGWAQQFARAGHPVYVFDPVDTGPSGIPVTPIKEGEVGPESINKWMADSVWSFFGIGSAPNEPYEDAQFPHESMDQLLASLTTRVGGQPGRGSNVAESVGMGKPNTLAIQELLEKTGPAIFVLHSFAGRSIYPLAQEHPDQVEAIVALETDGCITDGSELKGLTEVPYLTLYGDYLDKRAQVNRRDLCQTMADLIVEAGGAGELWNLPEIGISGNSHNLMQDRNSQELSVMALEWLSNNSE